MSEVPLSTQTPNARICSIFSREIKMTEDLKDVSGSAGGGTDQVCSRNSITPCP